MQGQCWGFPGGSAVEKPPAMQETWVWSLGWEDPLEEDMAIHSSILAWRIPWTEEPGGLQSLVSKKIRHDWSGLAHMHRPHWQPGPLEAESLGWEDPLEEGMAIHSSILAWRTPWTEEPCRPQSRGSQRVEHDWVTDTLSLQGPNARE